MPLSSNPAFAQVLTLGTCLACYRFGVSPVVRTWGAKVPLRGMHRAVVVVATVGLVLVPALVNPFHGMRDVGPLRLAIGAVVAMLTWRWVTLDYDVTRPQRVQVLARAALIAFAAAGAFYLPALLCWLVVACRFFDGWQHHAMMPIRLVKVSLAWVSAGALLGAVQALLPVAVPTSPGAIVMLLGCVSLSHYVKAAWSKARLGERYWDWALHNRTDYLAASAYAWGWARFLPERCVCRTLAILAPMDKPLNIATMAVESAGIVAFFDHRLLIVCLLATAGLSMVIALASGIFFWENIATNLILAFSVARSGLHEGPLFGLAGGVTAAAVILLACADLLWQPFHLGWWDSPFTARVQWRVETTSGRSYGLYNDFMCPYEREYGRVYGYFLTDEPVLHGHLGIVWDHALRDRIAATGGDRAALVRLKSEYGHIHGDPQLADAHCRYLTSMFAALNQGVRKSPLPGCLRRLKAPGGQLFHWGDLPRYRRQEPVHRIMIHLEERFYHSDTYEFELLARVVLREFDVHSTPLPTHGRRALCARSSSTAVPTSESS
jgi:hypothetical protein